MKLPQVAFVLPSLTSRIGTTTTRISSDSPVPAGSHVSSFSPSLWMGTDSSPSSDFDLSTFDLPLESTMQVSQIVYSFAELRKLVSDHEETFNTDLSDQQKKKRKTVAFDTPALVDTRFSADKQFPSTKMNNPVTAVAIKEFFDRNKKYFKQGKLDFNPIFVEDSTNEDPIYMSEILEDLGASFDADIVEFDDKFSREGLKTELVYSMIVNRSSKQIIVVFRGTVNPKDGFVDMRFFKTTPPIIKEITDRDPKLHKGFCEYLISETTIEGDSQLEQIISVLKEVYAYKTPGRDYSDYKLVLTGHSLGGALAQLLSFILAGSKEAEFIPKPVTAITYASPVVGDKNFFLAYQDLEKENNVRHVRVSNQKDMIPGTPGMGITKPFTQTGVNIHLKQNKKAEVGYENTKSILSQISTKPLSRHMLFTKGGYYERLYAKESGEFINKHVLSKTVEELYEDHALVRI